MANVSGTVIEMRKDGKGIKLDSTGYMYGAFAAAQLTGVSVGSEVNFDYTEGKPNPTTGMPYLNIKGNVKVVGGSAPPAMLITSTSSPSVYKHTEKVGEPILSNSRCIIRQNAMKTAADIIANWLGGEERPNLDSYFSLVREVAEKIEAYTSGDEDEANAKKELSEE